MVETMVAVEAVVTCASGSGGCSDRGSEGGGDDDYDGSSASDKKQLRWQWW
jgi:hypothetical protein